MTAPEARVVAQQKDDLNGLSVGADGSIIAASGFGQLKLWDGKGKLLGRLAPKDPGVCWFGAMSSKGVVATGFGDCTLWLWEPKKKKQRAVTTLGGIVASVAWSADGKLLFTGNCGDNTVRAWSPAGDLLASGKTKKSGTWFVALTPDGKTGFSGSGDKRVHVWDAKTCKETGELTGHTGKILGLAVSPDGRSVVSASQDGTARIWDVKQGKAVATLKGHQKQVISVAISPDGKRVATGSTDRTVRLWDAKSGKPLLQLPFDGAFPTALAWGKALYAAREQDLVAFEV